jgi:hypothetical protein
MDIAETALNTVSVVNGELERIIKIITYTTTSGLCAAATIIPWHLCHVGVRLCRAFNVYLPKHSLVNLIKSANLHDTSLGLGSLVAL